MFCEGATTNGTCLMRFRRGAFAGEKRVTPIYMKYPVGSFSTAYDVVDFLPLIIMNMSWAGLKCHVNIMSDFEPNEYLFTKHADKGTQRWEIFAWAVRDVMAKTGGFELTHLKLKDKVEYYKYMMGYPDAVDVSQDIEAKLLLLNETKKGDHTTAFDHVEEKLRESILSRSSRASATSREFRKVRMNKGAVVS